MTAAQWAVFVVYAYASMGLAAAAICLAVSGPLPRSERHLLLIPFYLWWIALPLVAWWMIQQVKSHEPQVVW